jgi:uncharacterized protein
MVYLIDGHNLIGQLPDLDLDDPNDEAKLVLKLISFSAQTGKRCVVIFDHGMPGGKSRLSTGSVEVIFSARPGEADDLMLARIAATNDTTGWQVVSSDRRVLDAAVARGMVGIRAADFAARLRVASMGTKAARNPTIPIPEKPSTVSASDMEQWLKAFDGPLPPPTDTHAPPPVVQDDEPPPPADTEPAPPPAPPPMLTRDEITYWLALFGETPTQPPDGKTSADSKTSGDGKAATPPNAKQNPPPAPSTYLPPKPPPHVKPSPLLSEEDVATWWKAFGNEYGGDLASDDPRRKKPKR